MRQAAPHTALGHIVRARRGLVHIVAWPYIHRSWAIRQRVDTVVAHYRHVERWPWLQVPLGARQVLAQLGEAEGGLTIQIDQPEWMSQEGELSLNLFEGDVRLYSVAFSIGRRKGRPVLYLGAIQGRSIDGASERYAELTKELHGCRPRDLTLLATLFLAEAMGIERAYGICDYYRHHRQERLLARSERAVPTADYDEIWRDRGGEETVDGFFAMSTTFSPRPMDSVPAKKRAMYRRRYEMLGLLQQRIHELAKANLPPTDLQHSPAR